MDISKELIEKLDTIITGKQLTLPGNFISTTKVHSNENEYCRIENYTCPKDSVVGLQDYLNKNNFVYNDYQLFMYSFILEHLTTKMFRWNTYKQVYFDYKVGDKSLEFINVKAIVFVPSKYLGGNGKMNLVQYQEWTNTLKKKLTPEEQHDFLVNRRTMYGIMFMVNKRVGVQSIIGNFSVIKNTVATILFRKKELLNQ